MNGYFKIEGTDTDNLVPEQGASHENAADTLRRLIYEASELATEAEKGVAHPDVQAVQPSATIPEQQTLVDAGFPPLPPMAASAAPAAETLVPAAPDTSNVGVATTTTPLDTPNAETAVPPAAPPVDMSSIYDDAASTPPAEDSSTINAYTAIQEHRQKKRRGRIIKSLAAAAVLAALVGGGAWWMQQNRAANEDSPLLQTDIVTHGDYETSVSASGLTRPLSSAEVTPEVDGIIAEVNVVEGDYVQKGDVLFVVRNEALDKALNDAKQAVTDAQKNVDDAQESVNKAEATLTQATNDYNRIMATGYASQEEADAAGAGAEQALESAQSAQKAAQTELDTAKKALTSAQDAQKEAQTNADKRVVTAPRDGTIITMNAKTGAAIGSSSGGSGDSSPSGSLITIGDLSQMRVTVQVNEVDISEIAAGQTANVTFSALSDLQLPATVEHISAVSSGSNNADVMAGGGIVTYDVDLLIPEPDQRVKPGMTARVDIITEDIPDVDMVPVGALSDNGDGTYSIYVVNEADNTTIERMVEVVAQNATTAVISGNVADGDIVQLVSAEVVDEDDEGNWEVAVG